MDIPKPFKGNYTIFSYPNNRYFSKVLDVKLNEEFNGVNFKAIPLVCEEQLSKNEKQVFEGKVDKHYSKLI